MAIVMKEGQVLNKWIGNRFDKNKNVLFAMTGATGSGKSYTSIRICELWYEHKFKEAFPVETHVCFSISELMKLLNSKKLRRGELIILEEAGTSLNALEYQNKVSKLFTFILQSFRSMNIGLIFTLPVLTMLNKSARLLLHAHFVTSGIDYFQEIAKIKPLFHQLNQGTGKSYWKYLRVKYDGSFVALERLNYKIPGKELRKAYEIKKDKFVYDLAKDFSEQLDEIEKENIRKMGRADMSDVELEVFEDVVESGLTPTQSSANRGRSKPSTYDALTRIKKKGYPIEKWIRYRECKSPRRIQSEKERIEMKEKEIAPSA